MITLPIWSFIVMLFGAAAVGCLVGILVASLCHVSREGDRE